MRQRLRLLFLKLKSMKENKYRIAIVGTSGSGKSTLAKQVSDCLGCDHIEMDSHIWLPDWQKREEDVFCESIAAAVKRDQWVSCGNYSIVRDTVWNRASHLVWIKLPFLVVLWQTFCRTMRRIFSKEKIAGGNLETIRIQFFSKKSIFLWVIQTHRRRSRVYSKLIEENAYPNLKISVLRSRKEIRNWLQQLKEGKL